MNMPSALAVVSSLVGFYYYRKLKGTYWITFPYYLFFQGFLDNLGGYFNGSWNILYYKFIVYPYLYLYYIWIFKKNAVSSSYNKIYNIAFLLFFVNYIILLLLYYNNFYNIFILGNIDVIHNDISSFDIYLENNTKIILFIIIITYFYEIISTSKILYFYQDLQFWVCLGLILFELFTFPYNTFKFYLFENFKDLGTKMFYIEKALCALMYFSFITGFICMKKR